MNPSLGFDQAPPISVPFRFFLTAPVFLAAAGMVLVLFGPQVAGSRWSPPTLAFVHLLTVGFMLQVMLGALLQFLPVAVGTRIANPRRLAGWVHPAVSAGGVLLPAALLLHSRPLAWAAAVALGGGIAIFAAVVGSALWRRPSTSATASALKIALAALLVAAALGLSLLLGRFGSSALPSQVTDLHAGWGLVGWAGLLLAGVAYVVVPMFQITPAYPPAFVRLFVPAVAVTLVLWSMLVALSRSGAAWPAGLVVLLAATFALATLRLQSQSKRPRADATVLYWRLGLVSLIAAAVVWGIAVADLWPEKAVMTFGVLVLPGFFVSLIGGMLYKIVPFLCWLHAQNLAQSRKLRAPHMGSFLADKSMRGQFWVHLTACVALFASAVSSAIPPAIGGVGLVVAAAWLGLNLAHAFHRFREASARMQVSA